MLSTRDENRKHVRSNEPRPPVEGHDADRMGCGREVKGRYACRCAAAFPTQPRKHASPALTRSYNAPHPGHDTGRVHDAEISGILRSKQNKTDPKLQSVDTGKLDEDTAKGTSPLPNVDSPPLEGYF